MLRFEEHVQAAPPRRRIVVRLAAPGAPRALLEQVGIDVREDRRPAERAIERARHRHDVVANDLRLQPHARRAPEQPVLRIDLRCSPACPCSPSDRPATSASALCIAFMLQPRSMNSSASQSSSSGCDGRSPILPKLLGVRTMPSPKWCCQRRLTITRAVSGLSFDDQPLGEAAPAPARLRVGGRRRERPLGLAGHRQHAGRHLRIPANRDCRDAGRYVGCGVRPRSPIASAVGKRVGRCLSSAAICALTVVVLRLHVRRHQRDDVGFGDELARGVGRRHGASRSA